MMIAEFEPSCHVPRQARPEFPPRAPKFDGEPIAAGVCSSCGEPSDDGLRRDVALVLFQRVVGCTVTLAALARRLRTMCRHHRNGSETRVPG